MNVARQGFLAVIRRFFESKFRKKSIVLRYDKCKDSEQKCLESFLFCAKSCKIHKEVILSFLETTFLNEGFVILDKQKKRAWMHTGNNRAVITLKTTFAETNYFHRCTSLSLYKICRAQSAVRTSVPCNYILKLAARGGRQFPLVFCQKEVYNANKNHYKKGDILWIAMYLKS